MMAKETKEIEPTAKITKKTANVKHRNSAVEKS